MDTRWIAGQQNRINFVMVDASRNEVSGIGDGNLTVEIAINNGAFAAALGANTEIGDGWYSYLSDATEGANIGDVIAVKVTGAGAIQQNLEYVAQQRTPLAVDFTYTITNSVTANPIEGVITTISTDLAGNNIIWRGISDSFGVARDTVHGQVPYLDTGTYYFRNRRSGFLFSNPDTEIITDIDTNGEVTGTPITVGGSATLTTGQPLLRTCLALARFAEIAGITPPHFWSAAGNNYFPVSFNVNDTSTIAGHINQSGGCNQLFFHWAWQSGDSVGRLDISRAIKNAEEDIENILGYPLCRKWIEDEVHVYPQHYRRDVYPVGMLNVRGQHKAVRLNRGKFVQGGRRATSSISASAVVTYSDEDNDGYNETATITASTTVTDVCEIKAYFAGEGGNQQWEIRPPRSVTLSGGTVTFTFDAWLLLDPDLQSAFPRTGGVSAIDLENINNYVSAVDIYREYNDFTQASAQLFWEPQTIANAAIVGLGCSQCGGSGCVACSLTAQDGCIHVRDTDLGFVVPQPATYDSDNAQWDQVNPTVCRDPDQVKFWYYAGEASQDYLSGFTCDPLSRYWAETIAWLATARLRRELCDCGPASVFSKEMQTDLAFAGRAGRHQLSMSDLDNPFGTMVGEVKAWRRVAKMTDSIMVGAGAV